MAKRLTLQSVLLYFLSGIVASSTWAQIPHHLWRDPFRTDATVAPRPGVLWESQQALPQVPAPPAIQAPLPTNALTLPELTEFALRNNPRARQAWFAARAAAAGVGIEKADELPQISATYSRTRVQPISATTGTVSPWQTRYGPAISFSYVLYDFGQGDNQIASAEFRLLAANLNQNRVLQDIVFQVEQAYYRLLGLDALVQTNELNLKNIRTALEAVQRRRESGLATVADVYRAETQVAQAQLNLTRARGEMQKARGQLAAAVGLSVDRSLQVQTLTELPQVQEVTASLGNWLDRAKASRPDLVAAEAQVRAARASAEAAAKTGLPTIELSGLAAHTGFGDNRQSANNYNLGMTVRIPLFSGFRPTYTLRQAEAQAAQAEASRDTLYRQSELEVWQAYYDVQTAAGGVGSTAAQVRSAEQTAQATLARYRAGFGSILDLITAQQDESNARVQQIQSYLDWYTALARLNFSAGMSEFLAASSGGK